MKLTKFKERNNKRIGIIVFTITCILLISGVILYRTFAIFEVKTNQNVINGSVQDPGNLYFAFYVNDGTEDKIQKEMPLKNSNYIFNQKKSYCGTLGENNSSIKLWFDRDSWSVIVEGITTSRTKCNLYFDKGESLVGKISKLSTVENGDGLYKVSHNDAIISYTEDMAKQEMLKQEERRYAGDDPDNYVWFNNELWRIIGLVNTPEGQRVKLIRKDSIGSYSWDSSDENVNNKYGVNDVHSFIEYVAWNLGSNGEDILWKNITTTQAYNLERSNATGDWCKSRNNNETWCNDKVSRSITWQGNVALMYPSDYGYATSGDSSFNREQCLTSNLFEWNSSCYEHNWLNKKMDSWTLTPAGISTMAELAYRIDSTGKFTTTNSHTAFASALFPTFYLKTDILVSINYNWLKSKGFSSLLYSFTNFMSAPTFLKYFRFLVIIGIIICLKFFLYIFLSKLYIFL